MRSKWDRFLDSVWAPILISIAILAFCICIGLSVSNFYTTGARKAQGVCMNKCKELGGTHGRLLLPDRTDGFYECRCISNNSPLETGSIAIEVK